MIHETDKPKKKLNWNALTHKAELVLEDRYFNKYITEVQQLFLNHLQRVTPTDKFDKKIRTST